MSRRSPVSWALTRTLFICCGRCVTRHKCWCWSLVISLLLQVPGYIIMTTGEIMLSITGLEFSYSQVGRFLSFPPGNFESVISPQRFSLRSPWNLCFKLHGCWLWHSVTSSSFWLPTRKLSMIRLVIQVRSWQLISHFNNMRFLVGVGVLHVCCPHVHRHGHLLSYGLLLQIHLNRGPQEKSRKRPRWSRDESEATWQWTR